MLAGGWWSQVLFCVNATWRCFSFCVGDIWELCRFRGSVDTEFFHSSQIWHTELHKQHCVGTGVGSPNKSGICSPVISNMLIRPFGRRAMRKYKEVNQRRTSETESKCQWGRLSLRRMHIRLLELFILWNIHFEFSSAALPRLLISCFPIMALWQPW